MLFCEGEEEGAVAVEAVVERDEPLERPPPSVDLAEEGGAPLSPPEVLKALELAGCFFFGI